MILNDPNDEAPTWTLRIVGRILEDGVDRWFLECGYLSLIRMLAESLCLPRMLNSWSGNLRHVVLKSRMFGLYVKTRPMLEEGMVMCYRKKWRLADDATTKTMEAALL
ncbi:hypothetical protein Tco_0563200 [Tanacetum coccineum]